MTSSSLSSQPRSLRFASVSKPTMKKYLTCVAEFIHHSHHQLSTIDFNDFDSIDTVLSEYIDSLYSRGKSYSLAVCTVYGLCLCFPKLSSRSYLAESKLCLKAWRRLQPSTSYPPLTYEVTCAIAFSMFNNGDIDHAIATLLAFDCYLRISEFSNLTVNDIIQPGVDARTSRTSHGRVIVCLAQTKTGRNQSVIVRRPEVAQLLLHFMQHKRSNNTASSALFDFTPASYRRVFHATCHRLGLSHISYTPHSLRHGGATFDFQNNVPIADIKTRGRWKDTKSAERYIQTGVALLRLFDVPLPVFHIGCSIIDTMRTSIHLLISSVFRFAL